MAVRAAVHGTVKRREDPRLITGAGRYTDDISPERCLHAVFVRSTHAHARISANADAARAMPGVAGAFLGDDVTFSSETARPRLCSDTVKFVGDAIGVVVAETRGQAVDAAMEVLVDYEPLPVLVDSLHALDADAPIIHTDKGDNIAFEFDMGEDGALDGAEVVVRGRFVNQRLAPVPIEANAVVAEPSAGGLTMWTSTQVPFNVRAQVAEALGLPESAVRVISADVGGAFGAKLMAYPEQSVIAAVARDPGRPVRGFEYRGENMTAMTHGRGLVQDAPLGAIPDG